MFGLENVFDLPVLWMADYVGKHIRQETDFVNEAKNAEMAHKSLKEVESLRKTCYVPEVHWDLTTNRILTAEWIEGISLNDVDGLKREGYSVAQIMTLVVNVFADVHFISL